MGNGLGAGNADFIVVPTQAILAGQERLLLGLSRTMTVYLIES